MNPKQILTEVDRIAARCSRMSDGLTEMAEALRYAREDFDEHINESFNSDPHSCSAIASATVHLSGASIEIESCEAGLAEACRELDNAVGVIEDLIRLGKMKK